MARRLLPPPGRVGSAMTIRFAKTDFVDIQPGTVQQVHRALASGKMIAVDRGPHDVATKLREISDELSLHFDPYQDLWVVVQRRHKPDGSVEEGLVTSATVCDERLVARVREVASPGYDLAAEIERSERDAEKAHEDQRREVLGDASEKLAFALSRDLGRHEIGRTAKSRAFIPKAFRPR
jgi:hypothetical protein